MSTQQQVFYRAQAQGALGAPGCRQGQAYTLTVKEGREYEEVVICTILISYVPVRVLFDFST